MPVLAELLEKKKKTKSLDLNDVNRPLIIKLFAIDVYGSMAFDEEVLELIVGKEKTYQERRREIFEKTKEELGSDLKRGKDGYLRCGDLIVLKPI